ncbi:uncharacterized protein MELLADRAFT_57349 [Melampsora larici-populina 98AG31]|uniref:Uncharacterized protein n=1 Tax=Melampsora larici-populina (strain 98AG31 / pathotype 3-4-7) TaxID=747676 RepID=F4S1A8_MELLP|nr:uncharacterized protein MELLADRAFT_57349 [Melampsora larici-populina 98AG31]EGG01592.1 hypothetical protein MELLADRAFT_57349 [Melampsora larici-populina 98AG31]
MPILELKDDMSSKVTEGFCPLFRTNMVSSTQRNAFNRGNLAITTAFQASATWPKLPQPATPPKVMRLSIRIWLSNYNQETWRLR